jgi:hypothetical protein
MNGTPQPLHRQAGGVSVWHAENLDVDALLESYGQRVGEGVLWLGHCVYVGLADDARRRDTGRVPLMAQYLHNVIGRHHVDAVRQAALEVGYVDRDHSYRAGNRSQAYWIVPPYDRAPLVRRQITNPALRHNVQRWREERRRAMWQRIERNETMVDAAVCNHLWRNLQRVRIDAAIDFGDAFHPAHQIAVEQIRRGELWFIVDDYGRIHTNLTNLPKPLRQYLSIDGRRLMDVDISESQPLFMGLVLARVEREGQADGQEEEGREAGRRQRGGRRTDGHGPLPLMFDNTMFDTRSYLGGGFDRKRLPADLRRYVELCERRGLYQAVANRLGRTRDEAKHGIMVSFFDKPWHRNATAKALEHLFPTVIQAMRRMKQDDYRRLAHFAQRIESAFMFGRVVPRIMELHPDLFVSTIHDSILTTAGDAEFVRQVMLDEFAQLGLLPQVKVDCTANKKTTHGRLTEMPFVEQESNQPLWGETSRRTASQRRI